MEAIYDFIGSITPAGFRADHYLKFLAIFALGGLAIAVIARLIFGKRSKLNGAISAAFAILCIYVVNVVVYSTGARVKELLSPLPFVTIHGDYLLIFDVLSADFQTICAKLLDMVILAFLVNLLETLLPQGKKLVSWYLWRMLTVVAALGLYGGVSTLIHNFAPEVYGSWAGPVLLGLWFVIALSGIAKLILTVALAAVNPVVAAVYAFFFSNLFGKQFTKSILTTLLLVLVFVGLYRFGFLGFVFTGFSLAAYAPTCLIALVALYLFGKLL